MTFIKRALHQCKFVSIGHSMIMEMATNVTHQFNQLGRVIDRQEPLFLDESSSSPTLGRSGVDGC